MNNDPRDNWGDPDLYPERVFFYTAMTLQTTLRNIDAAIDQINTRVDLREFPEEPNLRTILQNLRNIRQQIFDEYNRIINRRYPQN